MDMLEMVRAELIFDYIQKLGLDKFMDEGAYEILTKKHIENRRYNEAAEVISRMKFHDRFDMKDIMESLIDMNKLGQAKKLVENSDELKTMLIRLLASNENSKNAAKLIQEYKYDINEFPEVRERIMKGSMRFYLGKFMYNKKGKDDFMPLFKVEDLLLGIRPMLGYLVEDLLHKRYENEACGIYYRNKLTGYVRPEVEEAILNYKYDQDIDIKVPQIFGPLSEPADKYV